MQHLNWYDLVMQDFQLYHLSDTNHDNEVFVPRSMPKWRAMEGENWRIKRICVSTSIDGSLAALLNSDSQPFGKRLFVHVPEDIGKLVIKDKIYTPSTKQIPDVEVTNEKWIKCPCKMKCIGELEVVNLDESVDCHYEQDGQKVPVDKFIWKWIWQKDV